MSFFVVYCTDEFENIQMKAFRELGNAFGFIFKNMAIYGDFDEAEVYDTLSQEMRYGDPNGIYYEIQELEFSD